MAVDIMPGQISLFDLPPAPSELPENPPERPELKPLTLEAVNALEPFRTEVWIEERPWATQQVTEESEIYQFFQLFPAVFLTIGIPIGSERKHYHFKYTWRGIAQYNYCRVDEFYGREWRVWLEKPTEKQREATPWGK